MDVAVVCAKLRNDRESAITFEVGITMVLYNNSDQYGSMQITTKTRGPQGRGILGEFAETGQRNLEERQSYSRLFGRIPFAGWSNRPLRLPMQRTQAKRQRMAFDQPSNVDEAARSLPISRAGSLFEPGQGPWSARLASVVEMMREMSQQTDPQEMVRAYASRIRQLLPTERSVSLSRRDLDAPKFRVTRFTGWADAVNPWAERDRLPLLSGGLLGEIMYGDQPLILDDLTARLDPTDPAFPYLDGMRSLMALPNYDRGVALNWTMLLRSEPAAFDREGLPERVWMSNLFGRATQNLVLSEDLRKAYALVERELQVVADIQRSLLPRALPTVPKLDLAVFYRASRWAGGDYYDLFPLPDGRWGILIADVSGHGTPAAVVMAITQTIARGSSAAQLVPNRFLGHLNHRLARGYTDQSGHFVTAFYGVFDPRTRRFEYAVAGHNPPRVKRCATSHVFTLDDVNGLPLGLFEDQNYELGRFDLMAGDQLVLYTDGITEAMDPAGQLFGVERLDSAISRCGQPAECLIQSVLSSVETFIQGEPLADDQTLLVGSVG